ncbi:homeobox protein ANF-1-like [Tetranychus urticae]|uniref:Homeobox domain-containing protein n=1 Tax=Tetranychus urticae TaxID=32264 RepID=T1JQC9_TETUR|nr:homeobox protein ANF-1-like [Tetranychus urticae]XP_025016872.1 homeobox protein ANF-1-like [Tetranychus urticae]XP_025016876.1 homeobox protein ANF-1-like [Tetranychus urticae]XP_025016877.1 homeobox protein ANF-1-like [Tetranychus urticae]XP_025016879.1 homeobox protein ANF-1-like [Tetranychus urticae]
MIVQESHLYFHGNQHESSEIQLPNSTTNFHSECASPLDFTQQNITPTATSIANTTTSTENKSTNCNKLTSFKIEDLLGISSKNLKNTLKRKRVRTIFTQFQLDVLETVFKTNQYMVGRERKILASQLGLTDGQIKVWFQNRRIKSRKTSSSPKFNLV